MDEPLDQITRLARAEVESVKTAAKWAAGLVSGVSLGCAALVTLISYQTVQNTQTTVQATLKNLENRANTERESAHRSISEELQAKANLLEARGETLANQIESKIGARIDKEFTSDQIHAVIEAKARERVDRMSATLIERRVSEVAAPLVKEFADNTINPKVKELEKRFATLKEGMGGSETRLEALQASAAKLAEEGRILTLIMRVEADDYPAYVELSRFAASPDKTIGQLAQNAVKAVDARFSDRGTYESLAINDEVGELGLDKLIGAFGSKDPTYRRAVMDMLAERKEKTAIAPIVTQLQKETDIKVIRAGIRALKQITGENSGPLDLAYWVSWWEKNKPKPPG